GGGEEAAGGRRRAAAEGRTAGGTRGVDERLPRRAEPARDDYAPLTGYRRKARASRRAGFRPPPHTLTTTRPMTDPILRIQRRTFLGQACRGVGALALSWLLAPTAAAAGQKWKGVVTKPHVPPRAKRVIFMVMAGGPSHLELFD